ncbi:MAG: response regulator [Sedimentisphaerales bacterium]|nr:response regulator [Sedimentisphaerales bacterium]
MEVQKPKILIVDDKQANLYALESLLSVLPVKIYKASSGREGLEMTLNEDFALILLDVQMPQMDGYAVAECLHDEERTRYTPIIFITAIDRDETYEIRGYETGAVDFIFKPINDTILLGKVKVFLDLYQKKHELEYLNKQLEMAAQREKTLAQEAIIANQTKSEFLANMSHEIRTPMNAIIGFSELLALDDLSTQQRENIVFIKKAGKQLLKVINDILDLSKIEAGKIEVEHISCSVDDVLKSLETCMLPAARSKNIEFDIITNDDVPRILRTDPLKLEQCLINLVGNAIKFTDTGHVHVKVSLGERNHQSFILFEVEDTGVGIPEDKIGRIFESFTQADGSTTRKYGGTGLGLAITRKLAGLLQGKISVSSKPGKGSVFTLQIPAEEDVNTPETCVIQDRYQYEPDDIQEEIKFNGHVLVVEDNPLNQRIFISYLRMLGLEVALAEDGLKAIDAVNEQTFDLIFMDIQMPYLNGYEATRQIRQMGVRTPIVAVTAFAMDGDAEKCYQAGCDDYLPKPIVRQKILEVIGNYLASQRCG